MQLVHQARPVIPRDRLIRLSEVGKLVGCKKTTLYSLIKENKFPQPIRYSARLVVWSEAAVLAWVQDVVNAQGVK